MPRLIFASILISFPLIAQESANYSISGVVVNSQTGEPVKFALVTLMSFPVLDRNHPPTQPMKLQGPTQKTAQAGETGEFVFHGLTKAHYTLSAQKPGFAAGFIGRDFQANQIDLTDNVTGAQVRLSPLGVIEGKVLDQDDEPLLGVQILALQVQVNDGVRETSAPHSVATDDRGIYRIANLQPGTYYIKAAGKSGGTYRYVGDTNPYYSSWQSFAPVYTGGARTLDSAMPATIDPGTNATADRRARSESATGKPPRPSGSSPRPTSCLSADQLSRQKPKRSATTKMEPRACWNIPWSQTSDWIPSLARRLPATPGAGRIWE